MKILQHVGNVTLLMLQQGYIYCILTTIISEIELHKIKYCTSCITSIIQHQTLLHILSAIYTPMHALTGSGAH